MGQQGDADVTLTVVPSVDSVDYNGFVPFVIMDTDLTIELVDNRTPPRAATVFKGSGVGDTIATVSFLVDDELGIGFDENDSLIYLPNPILVVDGLSADYDGRLGALSFIATRDITLSDLESSLGQIVYRNEAESREGLLKIIVIELDNFGTINGSVPFSEERGDIAYNSGSIVIVYEPPFIVQLTTENAQVSQAIHSVTATFSEPIIEFNFTHIEATNAVITTNPELRAGEDRVYDFELTALQEGEISVTIPAGEVRSQDLNSNEASNVLTYVYDDGETTLELEPSKSVVEYVLGTGPVEIDELIIFRSSEQTILDGGTYAEISIIDGYVNGEDNLVFAGVPGESPFDPEVDFDRETGKLRLTALTQITVDQMQDALRMVQYENRLEFTESPIEKGLTIEVFENEFNNISVELGLVISSTDNNAPSVVIESDQGFSANFQINPFVAIFSEEVEGFEESDFVVENAAVSSLETEDSITFTFNVAAEEVGLVTVSIPTGVVTSKSGITNTASNEFSYTYAVEPTLLLGKGVANRTNLTSTQLTILSDIDIEGLELSDFQTTNASLSNLTGSGMSYTAEVVSTSDGLVEIILPEGSVSDVNGNVNDLTSVSWVIDTQGPQDFSVEIAPESINRVNATRLSFTVSTTEERATFLYSINAIEALSGTGFFAENEQSITLENIDVSALPDGEITVSVTLFDALGNQGATITDFVIKETREQAPQGFNPSVETWNIPWIEEFPSNRVTIFNQWGAKIWEIRNYNNNDRAWNGTSNVSSAFGSSRIPDGTYFYVIEFDPGTSLDPVNGFVIIRQ